LSGEAKCLATQISYAVYNHAFYINYMEFSNITMFEKQPVTKG